METALKIGIAGFPPLSARGCIQELKPVQSTKFRRTINGQLVALNVADRVFYQSTIYCEDKTAFASEGLTPGCVVLVECIQRLWQRIPEGKTEVFLEKNAIDESIAVLSNDQENIAFVKNEGTGITLNAPQEKECFVCYRPILNMMVKDFILTTNEWGMASGWRLNLEEV